MADYFDACRSKRNEIDYTGATIATTTEAQEVLLHANAFARTILEERKQPPPNRGRYYNHSGFADLVITGLLGLRPAAGNTFMIRPLVSKQWSWFALDGLPYHGHLLTVFYDKTGAKYHRGTGFHVLCDGTEIASAPILIPLKIRLTVE